jgi:ribosomal protein S18 acetylase RimI-like enzyme/chorismate mutase
MISRPRSTVCEKHMVDRRPADRRPADRRPVDQRRADRLVLRPAESVDLPAIADTYLAARAAAVPHIPPAVHSPQAIHAWVAGWGTTDGSVWVAEQDGLVGFARLRDDWLESLYVHPEAQGDGVGSALLELVKQRWAAGFSLHVFESNHRARRFYERHGLVTVGRTDGSANEERAPDLQMLWPGVDPVPALRAAVDDLDEGLARILAMRAGLTAAIQVHKAGSASLPVGRDPGREEEIVTRMALIAPTLGRARLASIMRAVISESLDAARTAD